MRDLQISRAAACSSLRFKYGAEQNWAVRLRKRKLGSNFERIGKFRFASCESQPPLLSHSDGQNQNRLGAFISSREMLQSTSTLKWA